MAAVFQRCPLFGGKADIEPTGRHFAFDAKSGYRLVACLTSLTAGETVGEKEDIREHDVLVEVAYGGRNLAQFAEAPAAQ